MIMTVGTQAIPTGIAIGKKTQPHTFGFGVRLIFIFLHRAALSV